jgi:hypothetical protein
MVASMMIRAHPKWPLSIDQYKGEVDLADCDLRPALGS